MKGLIAKKIGMTQIFDEEGRVIPVTVLQAGPCVVTQIKNRQKDGYSALQLGFGEKKIVNKPLSGHLKEIIPLPRYLMEIRTESVEGIVRGQKITVEIFSAGEKVKISGISIGKGFAGRIKRWHFHRGPMSHGSKCHRLPGSIGAGTTPGRVLKGMKMAGHLGQVQVTEEKIIIKIDNEKNLILVKGAVPGPDNGIVKVVKVG